MPCTANPSRLIRQVVLNLLLSAPLLLVGCAGLAHSGGEGSMFTDKPRLAFDDYQGMPQIIPGSDPNISHVEGIVFEDLNGNGLLDPAEAGLGGVKVSNGRDVILTGPDGRYELPVREDMAVFVIQPQGFQVPHDRRWIPQFSYQHKPSGSPTGLRFHGLPASGPIPEAIHFPLRRLSDSERFRCAILGDIQAYSNQEIGYFRDSTVRDLLDLTDELRPQCLIALGDVVGDDLGLIPRMAEIMAPVRAQQWWVHGNHDFDFDAGSDSDSSDSWRSLYGPNYYAFEIGNVLFIVLDNVVFPCSEQDSRRPGRSFCADPAVKRYNGRITDDQLAFVENLLALTPEDRLIVIGHHIPLVSFADPTSAIHQTDNATDLYMLLGARPALSLSGHTHSTENLSPGDNFAGWSETVGVSELPFRHIIAGAASGSWYQGDLDVFGVPMALQRLGAPRGWFDLDFDGSDYVETYYGSNLAREQRMWVSVNTPSYRQWFDLLMAWRSEDKDARDPVPPVSINDLPDINILTRQDLLEGSFLTANIWDGSSETRVEAEIAGRRLTMSRTQEAQGEAVLTGAEWSDPFAVQRQLSVSRSALQSRSGNPRNQGYEVFRGSRLGPSAPGPQGSVADRSLHLWRARLPEDLAPGVHKVQVHATDRHGRLTKEAIILEIRESRPPPRFRADVWNREGSVVSSTD